MADQNQEDEKSNPQPTSPKQDKETSTSSECREKQDKGTTTPSSPPRRPESLDRGCDPMMFAFDQSPQRSPQKPPTTSLCDSPSNSPRPKKPNMATEHMTQSSPPKFVSFDEIMKAANGVTNMTLAHEIAVDNDFRFQKQEPPPDSLEKQVQDIMHRAFWDVLDEKLQESPPDYSHALVLLKDVKDNVQDLLLPHHTRLRAQIDEVLDLDLIEQQAQHGVLNIQYYADYVISIMGKLCAPVRDDDITQLSTITQTVPLFKEIFSILDVMKLDLANYNIEQIRPYIQQQSVEYERTKFQQILEQQKENDRDGLECTKAWLRRAGDHVYQQMATPAPSTPSGEQKSQKSTASPAAIMNSAYMELLVWPENYVFPETLLLDHKRFCDLKEKCQWLSLVSSILMVTYNMIGDPIAGIRSFKEKLKNDIAVIIEDVPFESVSDVMPTVAEMIAKEVQLCLKKHGYPPLVPDRTEMLKRLVESVASPEQPVHKVLRKRLMDCVRLLLSSPGSKDIQVPSGFAAMAEEFSHVYGQFLRLVSHNRTVYGMYYDDIITKYLETKSAESSSQQSEKS